MLANTIACGHFGEKSLFFWLLPAPNADVTAMFVTSVANIIHLKSGFTWLVYSLNKSELRLTEAESYSYGRPPSVT